MKKQSGQFRRLTALALALCMLAALTAEIFAADTLTLHLACGTGEIAAVKAFLLDPSTGYRPLCGSAVYIT